MSEKRINRRNDAEMPKVNTFTAESARRLSESALTFPEMFPHEVAEFFDSDISEGLDKHQIREQRAKYGDNSLLVYPMGFKDSLLRQSKNLVNILLFFSLILFYAFRNDILYLITALGLCVSVGFNAFSEKKAEKVFSSIKRRSSPRCIVIREGRQYLTDSRSLVPGDIIVLEPDYIVPADARLIESTAFTVMELNSKGQGDIVAKDARFVAKTKGNYRYENMVYSGSIVRTGKAVAIVCATGRNTEEGKRRANTKALPKYLSTCLKASRLLAVISLFVIIITVLVGLIAGISLSDVFIVAMSIGASALCDAFFSFSVSAEASALESAMKSGCVFRSLDSVAPVAETDTIMCDKRLAFPKAEVSLKDIYTCFDIVEYTRKSKNDVKDIIRSLILCSSLKEKMKDKRKKKNPKESFTEYYEGGEFSLAALNAAISAGYSYEEATEGFFRIQAEYDSSGEACRVMGILDGKTCVILRGSPENVISRCAGYRREGKSYRFNAETRQKVLDAALDMAKAEIPVAVAMGYTSADSLNDIDCEKKLIFLGYAGFYTETRLDTASSIYRFNNGGINIAVCTDDAYYTAFNKAKNAGIIINENEMLTAEALHECDNGLFAIDNENYKLFDGISEAEWANIIRLRKQNGHNIFAGISDLSSVTYCRGAGSTFALSSSHNDAVLSQADVEIKESGFSMLEVAVKNAKLITKRISSVCQYLAAGFFTMFFYIVFSMMTTGKIPVNSFDIFAYAFLLNQVFCIPLAYSPANRKTLSESGFAVNPREVSNALLLTMGYSFLASIICVLCPVITGLSGRDAAAASMITYVFSLYLYSLMTGDRRNIFSNKFYRNYLYYISFAVLIAFVAITVYVPAIRSFFGFGYVPPAEAGVSAALPFILFLIIQLVTLVYESKKPNTNHKKRRKKL